MQQSNETEGRLRFTVRLNGTDTNPYYLMGLSQNPFPQIAHHRYTAACQHLQKLGADPIPDTDYIRRHLEGWSEEFVELCCEQFRKGEMVEFTVHFPA